MREEAELSIRELRAKQEQAGDTFGGSDPSHPPQGTADEPHYGPGAWQRRRAPWEEPEIPPHRRLAYGEEGAPTEKPVQLPFDPLRILDALKRKWYLWLGAGLLLGALGFCWTFWETRSIASMQLMRRELPTLFKASEAGDPFTPQKISEPALLSLMKSPEVLNRVAQKTKPYVSTGKLAGGMKILTEEGSEIVTVVYQGPQNPQAAVDLLNLYAREVISYTQEKQVEDVRSLKKYIEENLQAVDAELRDVNKQMESYPVENRFVDPSKLIEQYMLQLGDLDVRYELAKIEMGAVDFKRLQVAQGELDDLLSRYTELHPQVVAQKAKVEALKKQIASASAAGANLPDSRPLGSPSDNKKESPGTAKRLEGTSRLDPTKPAGKLTPGQIEELRTLRDSVRQKLDALSEKSVAYAVIKTRMNSLQTLRSVLGGRQREAQLFERDALGYYRVFTPASLDRAAKKSQWKKSVLLGVAGALFGLFSVAGLIAVREVFDDRIKTTADLARATKLPILGTLGNIKTMTPAAQANWAFRTWTVLKGKLNSSPSQGLVCGFISAHPGEGRSTWIDLLISTANQRGLRVLTVATQRTPEPAMHPHEATPKPEPEQPPSETAVAENNSEALVTTTLSPNVLAFPAHVTKQLTDPSSQSVVHIPLPGWVWNLERRRQWQDALANWQEIENLVLLVELPPASEPESVLLAEKLPQVIWLSDSGKATVAETRMHLETLRHAGCNMVGAVLNREEPSFWKRHFSRWMGVFAFAFFTSQSLNAAEPAQDSLSATNTRSTFSITATSPRAPWQQKLTLGPGDVLNFGLFGETNYNKLDVAIGPDGRVSYLQATDVMAAGKTVDELREAVDQELAKYYRAPRTLITPVTYRSKKYYMLGKVMTKGAFVLDRPITVVEAIARARGLETGLLDRNAVDIADLQHSFLVRGGKRIPIDLEKLFHEGDLSQNIAIEPDDFLYFPAASLKEVYVVGEVRTPGVVSYNRDTSVVAAIANRGGFTDRAYKTRVLVVRGSLNNPQTFVIDVWGALDARNPDFRLEPRDIVFVNHRPFIKAEEILDIAATAFIQSAVTSWTGVNVGPLIGSPIFPALDKEDR